MSIRSRLGRGLAVSLLVLTGACVDRDPMRPVVAPPAPGNALAVVECRADVKARTIGCVPVTPATTPGGARTAIIIGGQDTYVRVSTSNAGYDGGTQIFQFDLKVQNLLQQMMGTPNGSTVTGVNVFLHSGPTVTGGSGTVDVANEDGTGTFTGAMQPYFFYNQILSPFQISNTKTWQFSVSASDVSFTFVLYISADLSNEGGELRDFVWDGGGTDSLWTTAANWNKNAVPDSANTVAIPNGFAPQLAGNSALTNLWVNTTSTLDLQTFTLTAWGNVDAPGAITDGTVRMRGTGALLRGDVPALEITGSTSLQGGTTATGAVSVTGSLSVKDQALNISIP